MNPALIPGPGDHVVVWGFGTHGGGAAAARCCQGLGARVTILEKQPATAFGPEAAAWPWVVGDGSAEVLQNADLIIASPAIPPRAWPAAHPPRICPEHLFFARHRGPRVLVSGTKGKSTTARILGCLLGWPVGGNSYDPLLDLYDRHGPDSGMVCELSSFQAWYLASRLPTSQGAVLTSLAVDHLDWHPDLDHYHRAKLDLIASAPVVAAAPETAHRLTGHPGILPPTAWEPALAARSDLDLLGDHNRANAALAISLALHLGVSAADVPARLRAVRPLPHRLQPVPGIAPWTYIDDSIATTPESAMAAMAAISGPLAIILGGHDKGADFTRLAAAVAARGAHPLVIGRTGPRLAGIFADIGHPVSHTETLAKAIVAGRNLLPDGGTLLLSPACASFDQFRGFEDRGRQFQALAALTAPPTA